MKERFKKVLVNTRYKSTSHQDKMEDDKLAKSVDAPKKQGNRRPNVWWGDCGNVVTKTWKHWERMENNINV